MDLKIPKLDGLKDKLGFGEAPASRGRAAASRRDSYEEDYGYEDFGEYAFDDSADYAREGYEEKPAFEHQMPKLVTADDVRAHTQYTPSEEAASFDAQATRPNRDFAVLRAEEQRSPGLSGLFVPSDAQDARPEVSDTGAYAPADPFAMPEVPAEPEVQAAAFEPRVVQRATRIMTVIKPESYDEAERIAKVLKAGDVAVLSLRNTSADLGKRILDFSFGVACALDARVEYVSAQVYALSRGVGLTDGEAQRLRDQGLM